MLNKSQEVTTVVKIYKTVKRAIERIFSSNKILKQKSKSCNATLLIRWFEHKKFLKNAYLVLKAKKSPKQQEK